MTTPEQGPILELQNISYRYPDGSRGLECCSLSIDRGSRTTILGANGAGKTTLFLHLNGILRPQSGQILCNGTPLDYSRKGMRQLRSVVGLVFQNPDSQLFSASIREDVSFGPMNLGVDQKIVRERVEEALATVGLIDIADKPVHNLSYGQKKRVCIAGVLAMRPKVIVLDEPMAGLDTAMQNELTDTLEGLHDKGITIIIATHDLDFAYSWSDKIAVLQGGKTIIDGVAEEVFDNLEVQNELQGSPIVAEITKRMESLGFSIRSNGKRPHTKKELLEAISVVRFGICS